MNHTTPAPTGANQPRCFVHQHLTPAEYGFYDVCRSLTLGQQRSVLYFNGRKMAARFASMSKNSAYNYARSLERKGWLEVVQKPYRLSNGQQSPTHYKVLSHAEWAAKNPDACKPVQVEGQDDLQPVQISSEPVQKIDEPVQKSHKPVQGEGHNLCNTTYEKQPLNPTDIPVHSQGPDFCPLSLPSSSRRLGDRMGQSLQSPRRSLNLDRAYQIRNLIPEIADAIRRQMQAKELVATVAPALGLGSLFGLPQTDWTDGFARLLRIHSPETIKSVCEHRAKQPPFDRIKQEGPHRFCQLFDKTLAEMQAQMQVQVQAQAQGYGQAQKGAL